jgi:hypothetical protein
MSAHFYWLGLSFPHLNSVSLVILVEDFKYVSDRLRDERRICLLLSLNYLSVGILEMQSGLL